MVCFPPLTRLGAFWVLATLPTSTTFALCRLRAAARLRKYTELSSAVRFAKSNRKIIESGMRCADPNKVDEYE